MCPRCAARCAARCRGGGGCVGGVLRGGGGCVRGVLRGILRGGVVGAGEVSAVCCAVSWFGAVLALCSFVFLVCLILVLIGQFLYDFILFLLTNHRAPKNLAESALSQMLWLSQQTSITVAGWPALSVTSGFPFQRASAERHVEAACPETAHT